MLDEDFFKRFKLAIDRKELHWLGFGHAPNGYFTIEANIINTNVRLQFYFLPLKDPKKCAINLRAKAKKLRDSTPEDKQAFRELMDNKYGAEYVSDRGKDPFVQPLAFRQQPGSRGFNTGFRFNFHNGPQQSDATAVIRPCPALPQGGAMNLCQAIDLLLAQVGEGGADDEEPPEEDGQATCEPSVEDVQASPTQKNLENNAGGRFHGLLVLSGQAAGPAIAHVLEDIPRALELLNSTKERMIFAITGSNKDAVTAAVEAVKHVRNIWVTGTLVATDIGGESATLFIRRKDNWTERGFTAGAFYVYEYRNEKNITFYVGKGQKKRYKGHINDVKKNIDKGVPLDEFSQKEQEIKRMIKVGHENNLVRIVAEFKGDHAELCAFVVERFLICTVYSPFELKNEKLGDAYYLKNKADFHWLCQPQPVRQTPTDVPQWIDAAIELIETGRDWPGTAASLSWMLVRRYKGRILEQLQPHTHRLEFIGAGNSGLQASFEWNVLNLPVRIQIVFSIHSTTVRFNLRPLVTGWLVTPTDEAHPQFLAYINERFGMRSNGLTQVRIANRVECYFKPFAVGRTEADFDYSDPTSPVLVQPLDGGGSPLELNFVEAMEHLLQALTVP